MTQGIKKFRAPLTIRLEGPSVKNHRLALNGLASLLKAVQRVIDVVGENLAGRPESGHSHGKGMHRAWELQLVEVSLGSLSLVCDLPQKAQSELFPDIGEKTLDAFVSGIDSIARNGNEYPKGFDVRVLSSLKDVARSLDHGIDSVSFSLEMSEGRKRALVDNKTREKLLARIGQLSTRRCAIEGRLLMVDLRERSSDATMVCRIHPSVGRPVECSFSRNHADMVLWGLGKNVQAVGEAIVSENGDIRRFSIAYLYVLGGHEPEKEGPASGAHSPFHSGLDIDELAKLQSVQPVYDFDAMLGDFWPEDQSVDDFIAAIRRLREESNLSGTKK